MFSLYFLNIQFLPFIPQCIEGSTNVSSFINLPLYLFCVLRTIPVLKAKFRAMSLFLSPPVTDFVSDLLSDRFLSWISRKYFSIYNRLRQSKLAIIVHPGNNASIK